MSKEKETDIGSITEPFADFLTNKGVRFVLVAFDGDNVSLNYNLEDEIEPESTMPLIVCEAMERDSSVMELLTYAFVKYIKRNGQQMIDPSLN